MKTITTRGNPACIRAGAGAIWVGSQGTDDVYRIDPATNKVTTVHIGKGGELCVDPEDNGVWVVNSVDNSVSRLDPATNEVVARRRSA